MSSQRRRLIKLPGDLPEENPSHTPRISTREELSPAWTWGEKSGGGRPVGIAIARIKERQESRGTGTRNDTTAALPSSLASSRLLYCTLRLSKSARGERTNAGRGMEEETPPHFHIPQSELLR